MALFQKKNAFVITLTVICDQSIGMKNLEVGTYLISMVHIHFYFLFQAINFTFTF